MILWTAADGARVRPGDAACGERAVRHGAHQRHPQRQLPRVRQPAADRHHLPDRLAVLKRLQRLRLGRRPSCECLTRLLCELILFIYVNLHVEPYYNLFMNYIVYNTISLTFTSKVCISNANIF